MGNPLKKSASPRLAQQGAFVVLVGPDGVGKTSVARALLAMHQGDRGYVHFRPPLWSKLAEAPTGSEVVPAVKNSNQGHRVIGWLRIVWSLLLFWCGYLTKVLPKKRGGSLIVGDRWGYGYFAQPLALRYYGPTRLAKWVIKLLPRPDLLINLHAPVEVILERKVELSDEQISTELSLWSALPESRLVSLEATNDVNALAERIYSMVFESAAT